jgi:hypothetical protein
MVYAVRRRTKSHSTLPAKPAPTPIEEGHTGNHDGKPTNPLDTPVQRRRAREAQETLQRDGADALPVSDYPEKKGTLTSNRLDRRSRSNSGS